VHSWWNRILAHKDCLSVIDLKYNIRKKKRINTSLNKAKRELVIIKSESLLPLVSIKNDGLLLR